MLFITSILKLGIQIMRFVKPQFVAFYFALVHFICLSFIELGKLYFESIGDAYGRRRFAMSTLWLGLLMLFAAAAGMFLLVVGVASDRRLSWRDIATLAMLAPVTLGVGYIVLSSYYQFIVLDN
jgi:hypothetical protein